MPEQYVLKEDKKTPLVDHGWTQKKWRRQSPEWAKAAKTSIGMMKKMWTFQPIEQTIAKQVCEAVGITNWQDYFTLYDPNNPNPQPSAPFYDRTDEIKQLKELINNNRLVLLHGLSGNGKTALVSKVLSDINGDYPNYVRLGIMPNETFESILKQLVEKTGNDNNTLPQTAPELFNKLITNLTNPKYLIILDDVHKIINDELFEKLFKEIDYKSFFTFNSKLLLISQIKPPYLSHYNKNCIKSYELQGFGINEIKELLINYQITATEEQIEKIRNISNGNGYILNIIIEIIIDQYNYEIQEFLNNNSRHLGWNQLLQPIVDNLSQPQKAILKYLADSKEEVINKQELINTFLNDSNQINEDISLLEYSHLIRTEKGVIILAESLKEELRKLLPNIEKLRNNNLDAFWEFLKTRAIKTQNNWIEFIKVNRTLAPQANPPCLSVVTIQAKSKYQININLDYPNYYLLLLNKEKESNTNKEYYYLYCPSKGLGDNNHLKTNPITLGINGSYSLTEPATEEFIAIVLEYDQLTRIYRDSKDIFPELELSEIQQLWDYLKTENNWSAFYQEVTVS